MIYPKATLGFESYIVHDSTESSLMNSIAVNMPSGVKILPTEIVEVLGEPTYQGQESFDGKTAYLVSYEIGKFYLTFFAPHAKSPVNEYKLYQLEF